MSLPSSRPDRPRWRALLGLTIGVLLAHVWLLAGGVPRWPSSPPATTAPGAVAAPTPARPSALPPEAPARADPVTLSRVRWIPPSPLPTPAPPAAAAQPRPTAEQTAAAVLTPRPSPGATPEPGNRTAPPAEATAVPALPADSPTVHTASEPPTVREPDTDLPPPLPGPDDVVLAGTPTPQPTTQPSAQPAPSPAGRQTALPPAQPPGPVDWLYDMTGHAKGLRYSAEARLRWQPNGTRYSAELAISAWLMGSRVQTSHGQLGAQGLVPERFGDRRRSAEKATHFDHPGQRIRYSSNAPDSPLLPGAQDRLSVFLQLAALLQARPNGYPPGHTLALQVAGSGDAEIWSFQVGPEETLALPTSSLSARHLTRLPRRAYDNTVEVWLAPGLQHLPVRIRITEHNGDAIDLQLRQRG